MRFHIITFLFILSAPLLLAQTQSKIMVVEGKASVKATPERTRVNIPLNARDSEYSDCNDKLISTFNSLKKALVKAGFEENQLKSSSIRIDDDYQYQNSQRVKVGYIGNMSVNLEMTTAADELGDLIDVLSKPEFSFGYSLNFALSEEQKLDLENRAMETAVRDAKHKAQVLANAADVELGYILELRYSDSQVSVGPLMRAEFTKMSDDTAGPISLNPSEINIEKSVVITWGIGRKL